MLIVGFGHTGRAVAGRAKAMGLTVLAVRARPAPSRDADEVHAVAALPELWSRADFIVVAVPLLPSTRGLVGAAAFGAMRPEAVLIDVSRGGVVDEAALVARARGGDASRALPSTSSRRSRCRRAIRSGAWTTSS